MRPLIIAHRCGPGRFPEQSLASARHALALGADLVEMDVRFHDLIYTMSDHQMLTDALQPMLRKIMKFRRESMDILSRAERSVREHRSLYEAIAAGERDRAESLMTHHVDNARQSILDACRE